MPLIDPYDIKPAANDIQPQGLIDPYSSQTYANQDSQQSPATQAITDPQATGMFNGGAVGQALDKAFSYLPNLGSGQQFLDARKQSQQEDMQSRQQEAASAGAQVPAQPTKYGALIMSQLAEQPQSKIAAFAKSRFPNMPLEDSIKRYGVMNNHIVFVGQDGHLYAEDQAPLSASLIANSPNIIGQIAGGIGGAAIGGVPGAIAGGGLGSAIGGAAQNAIAHYALGENQSAGDYTLDAAGNTAFGAFNEGLGQLPGRVIAAYLKSKGGEVLNKIISKVKGVPYVDPASVVTDPAAGALINDAQNMPYPVQLTKAEATQNKFDMEQERVVRQSEGGAPKFQAFEDNRNLQVIANVNAFHNAISPGENVPYATSDVQKAAQGVIQRAIDHRQQSAALFYKQAENSNAVIDVNPVVNYIEEQLKTAKGQTAAALNKSLELLKPANGAADAGYDTTVGGLHGSKLAIDDMINGTADSSLGNNTKRVLAPINEKLVAQLRAGSPDYDMGRATYASQSKKVNALQDSVIGNIADTNDPQLEGITGKIFDVNKFNRRTFQQTKSVIQQQNPEAWNAITRDYLQSAFNGLRDNLKSGASLGKAFSEKLMGTQDKRDMLGMALQGNPQAYENFKTIARIFPRLSTAEHPGSPTATRGVLVKALEGGAPKAIIGGLLGGGAGSQNTSNMSSNNGGQEKSFSAAGAVGGALAGIFGGAALEKVLTNIANKRAGALAEAIMNPKYAPDMLAIRQMNPGSKQATAAFVNLLSRIGENAMGQNYQYLPDQSIPMQQQKQ